MTIDCEASAFELTPDTVAAIESLAPFGAGNPKIRLLVRGLRLAAPPSFMGAGGKHVSMQLRADDRRGGMRQFRAIAWNWGEHAGKIGAGSTLDVVITPRVSRWNGSTRVEPEIADVALR